MHISHQPKVSSDIRPSGSFSLMVGSSANKPEVSNERPRFDGGASNRSDRADTPSGKLEASNDRPRFDGGRANRSDRADAPSGKPEASNDRPSFDGGGFDFADPIICNSGHGVMSEPVRIAGEPSPFADLDDPRCDSPELTGIPDQLN